MDSFFTEGPNDRGDPPSNTHSQESLRALSRRYEINPKTVAKRKNSVSVADLKTRP
jgi:hypothetical protein